MRGRERVVLGNRGEEEGDRKSRRTLRRGIREEGGSRRSERRMHGKCGKDW